jgi:hypothetical protein
MNGHAAAMALVAVCGAAALTLGPAAAPAGAQAREDWTAFDANFVRTEPGARKVVGWFHRSADGSTREESNADGPSAPVTFIMNVAKQLQYRFEGGAWASFPVKLSPNGWHPEAVEHDPRTYRPAPAIEKMPVFRFVNPQGLVLFVAPALNDFPLVTERPGGGREAFSNVFIREQPAGLFEPPPATAVHVYSDGWSGAVWSQAGQNPRAEQSPRAGQSPR